MEKGKFKVVVRLMGRDYTLVTDEEPEQVKRMARYVDMRMRELAIVSHAQDSALPVLAAITLAEELFSAKDENIRLQRELAEAKGGE